MDRIILVRPLVAGYAAVLLTAAVFHQALTVPGSVQTGPAATLV